MYMLNVCGLALALVASGCIVNVASGGELDDVESEAEAAMPAPPQEADQACGGVTGLRCAEGLYCNYDVAAACGAGDRMGTCMVAPRVCPMILLPVCGCDGKDYSSPCRAEAAGVSPAHPGACR